VPGVPGVPNVPGASVRVIRAGLLTALVDGLFSSALAQFAYGSSVTRLFQGVAATLFGPGATESGRMAIAGVIMHFGVAFTWSAIFLILYERSRRLRDLVASRLGVLKVAAVYGPLVWVAMSLVVIPALTGRPPAITIRWWNQFFGHAIFVGLPIVAMIARPRQRARLNANSA
jgi:hypothetical protein